MKHLTILLSIFMFALSSATMAQEDDMYFTTRKDKKEKTSETKVKTHSVEIIYEDEEPDPQAHSSRITAVAPTSATRDVDEYNRRGRTPSSSADTLSASSSATPADTRTTQTYELSAQSLYDLGYDEGYTQGFSDAATVDYYYGLRLARFHGCRFYDPWYWNRVSYVYDPWFWDPWYYDPWYRPYYYGGWYSVGWGVGYYGSYWYPYHHYPHHHHHYWGPGHPHSHGPRYSTSRNHDYGRARIVDRSSRVGEGNRYVSHGNDRTSVNRGDNRYSGSSNRATRYNERSSSRSNRVTDRSSNRVTDRSSTRTTDRTSTSRTDRSSTVNRSSSRSSSSSSSRIGSSSSSSRSSGVGSRSGGGVRSVGGSRGGRGR